MRPFMLKKIFLLFTLLFLNLLHSCEAYAQQYLEKQDTPIINLLANAGYESGKGARTISVSSTVTLATGASALQGATSLRFHSTAASQTVTSALVTVPPGLIGRKCQGEVTYLTLEDTNKYIYQVLNASGTVIASKTLDSAIVMGVPVEKYQVARVRFDCPSQMRDRVISTSAAIKVDLDSGHLGSVKNLEASDIFDLFGYVPVQSVTVNSPLVVSGTATNPVISMSQSGAVSGASYTKVYTDGYGRVTSGTTLSESDIPSLQTTKIASGVFSVARGGTGVSSVTTGDQLVGSGSALVKIPIGSQGKVWTVGASNLPEWAASTGGSGGDSGVNLITNNSFELDVTTGWVASGVTVTRTDFTNGTSSDAYFASMTATVSGAYFETSSITIPDNMRGGDLEFGGYYVNALGTWKAEYFVSGTIVASQTLASSTVWASLPMMTTGVASNQTTTKVRFISLTSGTAELGLNKVYDGSLKSFKSGAIIEPTTSYSPTTQGFGSITSNGFEFIRVGDSIFVKGRFVVGTSTAVEARIGLPNNLIVGNIPTQKVVGQAYRNGQSDDYTVLAAASNNYITFGITTSKLSSVQANTFVSSGDVVSFVAGPIPIQNLQGTGVTLESRCPTAISCTNEFSFKSSTSGAVTDENLDWINGNCTNPSTGNYTCTYNTGIFTVTPNCIVTVHDGSPYFASITISNTSVSVQTFLDNGILTSRNFTLHCQKQGADFFSKKTIEGYLSKSVTSTGNFIERIERVAVASACSASPCTITSQSGAFTSITRSSTGTYTVNYNSSTWSQPPTCLISVGAQGASTGGSGSFLTAPTTSNFQFLSVSTGNTLFDNAFFITCVGPR